MNVLTGEQAFGEDATTNKLVLRGTPQISRTERTNCTIYPEGKDWGIASLENAIANQDKNAKTKPNGTIQTRGTTQTLTNLEYANGMTLDTVASYESV